MPDTPRRWWLSRENRLLLITIAVSVTVLLLLARFRFPEQARSEPPAPAPLERLAARATYEELSSIIAQLGARLAGSVAVLRVTSDVPPGGTLLRDALGPRPSTLFTRFVPAIYVRHDLALAGLEPGDRVQSVVGREEVPIVLATDEVRRLALVRVPPVPDAALAVWAQPDPIESPRYVAVVEGSRGGPAVRPLFLGRADPINDPVWDRLLEVGGIPGVPAGALVFSLDARLIGAVVTEEGLPAIAPANLLIAAAERLIAGEIVQAGSLGIDVQNLTPSLSAATKAEHGVIVAYVNPNGPSAEALRVGDVIQRLNGQPVFSRERFIVNVNRTRPGTAVALDVLRAGEATQVEVTVEARLPANGEGPSRALGLIARQVPRTGAEVVRVSRDGAAAAAGLQPGDVITHLDGAAAPTPAQITAAFARAPAGSALLLGIERGQQPIVLAVEKR
jgi:serine protease Do